MSQAKSTTPPRKNDAPRPNVPSAAKSSEKNEGEGSKTAARNYDEGAERFARSGSVERAAKEAEDALDGSEGDELRAAEEEARETEPEAEPGSLDRR